jgi:predicted transcriptional regulator
MYLSIRNTDTTLQTIASAAMMSTLSIEGVTVRDMIFFATGFSVQNTGSMLLMNNSMILNNNNDMPWRGVAVVDSAEAVIEESTFSGNELFEVRRRRMSFNINASQQTFY